MCNIGKREEMTMNYNLIIEPFDVVGMDYVGPFPPSNGNAHILVVVDYVTKWVEDIATPHADAATSLKMIKDITFLRFGVPRFLVTHGGSHFINCTFKENTH
jgi:hypothetical protein